MPYLIFDLIRDSLLGAGGENIIWMLDTTKFTTEGVTEAHNLNPNTIGCIARSWR